MTQENQPIVVNLPEGQNTLTLLQGVAPKQLDRMAPLKINISGSIEAPLEFLRKRIGTIQQLKAHIIVCRDDLSIRLIIDEDDPYLCGIVSGTIKLSKVFTSFGINTNKEWEPEALAQFLKMNRTYFKDRNENMKVVNALKTFDAKVNQAVKRDRQENGNKDYSFRQAVDSNIPEKFKLCLPVISGGPSLDIEVETYATIDGMNVNIMLQSPGANDIIEDIRNEYINSLIGQTREIAPDIVIIEQ